MSEWHWPQYFYVICIALNLMIASTLHGRPKHATKHSFPQVLVSSMIVVFVLHCGGFW